MRLVRQVKKFKKPKNADRAIEFLRTYVYQIQILFGSTP